MQGTQTAENQTAAGLMVKGASVDGITMSIDDIVENTIYQLHDCFKDFYDIWETFFAWRDEPKEYKTSWYILQQRLTVQRHLLEHITDKLMLAYNIPSPAQVAEIITLYGAVTEPLHSLEGGAAE